MKMLCDSQEAVHVIGAIQIGLFYLQVSSIMTKGIGRAIHLLS